VKIFREKIEIFFFFRKKNKQTNNKQTNQTKSGNEMICPIQKKEKIGPTS